MTRRPLRRLLGWKCAGMCWECWFAGGVASGFLAGCVRAAGVAWLWLVGGGVGVGVCIVASPSSSAGHRSPPVTKDALLDSSVVCFTGGELYCAVVGCGWLCARVWAVVLCASLVVLLVCIDVRGVPGCCVPSGGLVDDRTSYRCVLVAVLVGEAARRIASTVLMCGIISKFEHIVVELWLSQKRIILAFHAFPQ